MTMPQDSNVQALELPRAFFLQTAGPGAYNPTYMSPHRRDVELAAANGISQQST